MWHAKQENIVLPGQTSSTPKRFLESHIGKMIHPPPSVNYDNNFTGGSSRKRKSRDMDSPGATPEYRFPWESNPRDIGSALESNRQGNYVGVHFNQRESAEPGNFRQQFKNDQFHLRNDFPETWPISSMNFHRNGIDRISNDSLSLPPQYLQPKGPLPLRNLSVRETPMVPNGQTHASYAGHFEAHRFLPFPKSGNQSSEKAHIAAHLQDLTGSEVNDSVFRDKLPQEMCHTTSEQLRPVENLHQPFFQRNMFFDGLNRRTFSREDKFESVQLNQSGNCSNDAAIGEPPNAETSSLGASVYGDNRSLEHEVQISRARFNYASQNKERIHGDGDMIIKEITTASDTEKLKYSVSEDIPSKKVGEIVGNDKKNDESHSSPILKEKSSLISGTAASTVAEKLWDGSLQLSSSVTLSAVAFFRSGERLLDAKWSEFVEVKGKVRLEAFEKYIQDLPRSRNRGLMVISLCWKEGSSETGLTGMKEVAKGLIKGAKVGFAQLSAGIDLYICPRCDTIITILAKYGFFKGMAAIEDNQDSLIGCVVWKKNRAPSIAVVKKLEGKDSSLPELPLNSPSGSFKPLVTQNKLSPTQLAQKSDTSSSLNSEKTGRTGTGSKNHEYSEVQFKVCESSKPLIPSDSYEHLDVEASRTRFSGTEQPKPSSELQKYVLSPQSNGMKQVISTSDDDDLPEYEFGTACGISTCPTDKPLGAVKLDRRLPAKGFNNSSVVQATSASSQNSDSGLPRIPSAAKEGMPPVREGRDQVSQLPVYFKFQEKSGAQSIAIPMPVSYTVLAPAKNSFNELPKKTKNLFDDDDDDMPEWCPPKLNRQALTEPVRPPTTLHSELPKSGFQHNPPAPPRPILPPPPPVAIPTAISSQAFRPVFHHSPVTVSTRPSQPVPFPNDPRFAMGRSSNPALGPQSSPFGGKLGPQFPGRRGWKP